MAITETRPPTEPVADDAEAEPERFIGLPQTEIGGLAGFIGTGDHRALGRAYILVSLLLGLGALTADTLFTAHQAHHFLPVAHVFQVYTSSRTAAVLLFAIPLFIGLATAIVPLQVGANTIAFPRAAAAAFWGWLIGSGVLIAAYAVDGGPGGSRAKAVDLSFAGLALVLVALIVASLCVVTTVISLRAPGQWLDRVPMFSWSMLVAGSLWLLTLPVILANVVLIYVDHHYGRPSLFGISTNQWTQLAWAFGQPQIYAIAIPVLGVANDVIATLAGHRQPHRKAIMAAIGLFGILAFGAFAQPAFYPDVQNEALFVILAFLIILPALVILGGWAACLRGGRAKLVSPLLFSLGAGLLAVVATVAGALFAIKALDLHAAGWNTTGYPPPYADGHFLLVLAVVVVGAAGGLTYWSSKIFGRAANEGLSKLAVLVGVVGGLVAGLPLCIYGFALKAHGLVKSAHFLYGTSAVGSALLVVTVLLVAAAILTGHRGVDDDPWGVGQTFEWTTASPPAPGGFGVIEPVRSAEPMLDLAEAQEGEG
jgi:heme/copper-type cytochrome/quinol oxidase subunit 1